MALTYPELSPSEIRWVVETLKAAGQPPREMRSVMRRLERHREAVEAAARREVAEANRMRSALPTDKDNACPECWRAAPFHTEECSRRTSGHERLHTPIESEGEVLSRVRREAKRNL